MDEVLRRIVARAIMNGKDPRRYEAAYLAKRSTVAELAQAIRLIERLIDEADAAGKPRVADVWRRLLERERVWERYSEACEFMFEMADEMHHR